jgi:hypothetical protein
MERWTASHRRHWPKWVPERVALNPFSELSLVTTFSMPFDLASQLMPLRWPESMSMLGQTQHHQPLRMLWFPFKTPA